MYVYICIYTHIYMYLCIQVLHDLCLCFRRPTAATSEEAGGKEKRGDAVACYLLIARRSGVRDHYYTSS